MSIHLLVDLSQDLRVPEKGVLVLADLDGATTELRDQDLVARGNTHRQTLAVLVEGTGADGENLGLVLLLDTALREEDTRGSLGLGLDALDQDAVQEGGEGLDVTEGRLFQINNVSILDARVVC